jgi:hypothetical protein
MPGKPGIIKDKNPAFVQLNTLMLDAPYIQIAVVHNLLKLLKNLIEAGTHYMALCYAFFDKQ